MRNFSRGQDVKNPANQGTNHPRRGSDIRAHPHERYPLPNVQPHSTTVGKGCAKNVGTNSYSGLGEGHRGYMTASVVRDLKCPSLQALPTVEMTPFDHLTGHHAE